MNDQIARYLGFKFLTPLATGLLVGAVLAIPGAIQFTIGNLIEPRILGESLRLHPVVVLLSLLLWGFLWGIPGMLLAVPIKAVLKILFDRSKITASMARLLEGRATSAS